MLDKYKTQSQVFVSHVPFLTGVNIHVGRGVIAVS